MNEEFIYKDELKESLLHARSIAHEIEHVQEALKKSSGEENVLMQNFLNSSKEELKKISLEIPGLLVEKKKKTRVELEKSEKREYLREADIEKETLKAAIKKIEKKKKQRETKEEDFIRPGFFVRASSRIFSPISIKLARGSFFHSINSHLRKSNMPYLLSTYISMAIFATIIAVFISLIAGIILFSLFGAIAALVFIVPLITFIIFIFYPSTEISSIRTEIDDELPFATMHMAAIASSGVEPSRVFSILASSPEYPKVRKEMRKIVNMINFYGYDLTTALKVTAKTTSSNRLANLLNGMSSTISGGGDLKTYLEKISSDSLLDYKLRRRQYTTVAETYADIYTGLLIAAPLMFMLILVLMNVVTGNIGGLPTETIAVIGIGIISLLNVGFLVFLEISQPSA